MPKPWRCPVCGWDETLDLSHEQCLETLARWIGKLLGRNDPEVEELLRQTFREEMALVAKDVKRYFSPTGPEPPAKPKAIR